jgi:hypothetical protein
MRESHIEGDVPLHDQQSIQTNKQQNTLSGVVFVMGRRGRMIGMVHSHGQDTVVEWCQTTDKLTA